MGGTIIMWRHEIFSQRKHNTVKNRKLIPVARAYVINDLLRKNVQPYEKDDLDLFWVFIFGGESWEELL